MKLISKEQQAKVSGGFLLVYNEQYWQDRGGYQGYLEYMKTGKMPAQQVR